MGRTYSAARVSEPSPALQRHGREAGSGGDSIPSTQLVRHAEATGVVHATPPAIFDFIDRPERLSAHMAKRSWQMAGASMKIGTDAAGGRAVGSRIRLSGRMLGIPLCVEGEVTARDPPRSKSWETVDEPRLVVVGRYRMSARIEPRGNATSITIAIDYALPSAAATRWLAYLFGPFYARWCVRQMVRDVVHRFEKGDHSS